MFTYVSSGQNKININEKEKIKLTPVYSKEENLVSRQFTYSKYITVFIKNGIHILKLF